MQHSMAFPMASLVFAITILAGPDELGAQDLVPPQASGTAAQIGARSRERTVHWAVAAPVIHCGPAPLTERPGSSAELARPRVAPLEAAFLDAAIIKRALAARSRVGGTKP